MYIGSSCVWFTIGGCLFGQSELSMEFIIFLSVQGGEPHFVYSSG